MFRIFGVVVFGKLIIVKICMFVEFSIGLSLLVSGWLVKSVLMYMGILGM